MQREDWDRRYGSVENLWAAKPNRFLVAEVGDLEPGRALDLACGEGQNAIWLATLGWRVTGVDYSEVAIGKAIARAERDGVDIEFRCADLVTFEPVTVDPDVMGRHAHHPGPAHPCPDCGGDGGGRGCAPRHGSSERARSPSRRCCAG